MKIMNSFYNRNLNCLSRYSSEGALNTSVTDSWANRKLIQALKQLPSNKFGSTNDMRFQQKQQQEREKRKIEMTGDDLANNTTVTTIDTIQKKATNSTIGPGKVRQMFDERRQRSTGIDKSYPLKPIRQRLSLDSASSRTTNTTTTITAQKQTSKQLISSRASSSSSLTKESLSSSNRQFNDILNGNENKFNSNDNLEQDNIESETFPSEICISSNNVISNGLQKLSSKLPNVGKHTSTTLNKNKIKIDNDKNNNANDNINSQNTTNLKLKPVVVKKIPPTESLNKNLNPLINNENKQNKRSSSSLNTTLRRSLPTTTVLSSKENAKNFSSRDMSNKIIKETNLIANKSNTNSDLPTCHICHRGFNADRLEKHEQICEKTASKKRKKFDIVKHRVSGTDAEKYVKKSSRIGGGKLVTTPAKTNIAKPSKESNWRRTHEDFINTIRAAKQMQTYLAKGGKLSDLPPPPPSENPDYIQCPHCNRRFNQNAAERHIPKCATFLHNKPKPVAPISLKKRY